MINKLNKYTITIEATIVTRVDIEAADMDMAFNIAEEMEPQDCVEGITGFSIDAIDGEAIEELHEKN